MFRGEVLQGPPDEIKELADRVLKLSQLGWNDGEAVLATGSADNTVKLWDMRNFKR